jgi:acyl-CoA thioester hydrolase
MTQSKLVGEVACEGNVHPDWVDINDHMNVAYYVLAFDYGVDALWERFGINDQYMSSARGSTFAVECHLTYQRELVEGDPYIVTAQILAFDEKRIHQFLRLYHADQHYLAATAEWMNLHVNLDSRRVCPWPESILSRIRDFAHAQAAVNMPVEAGKKMKVKNPLYTLQQE